MSALLVAAALCVAAVHDGDTIRLCSGERVRIAGIDAPDWEDSPPCRDRRRSGYVCDDRLAAASRAALIRALAAGQPVMIRTARDHYGRTVARIIVGSRSIGCTMIARGQARARFGRC